MKRIDAAERRARIGVRHLVAPEHRVSDAVEVARGVVCFHATDPASVYLSAWSRMTALAFEGIERALYDDKQLIRMLAMRRTMFVVPVDEAPILQAAASFGVARNERRRNQQLAAMLDVPDADAFLREAEEATLAALDARGTATAQELSADVPALGRRVRLNVGKKYEGEQGFASRILLVLAVEGEIVRTRPRGTWISSQYRWATMESWLGRPLPILEVADAQAQLIRRWLARFGPGTELDMRWWTGLTAREVRAAIATVKAEPVELEDGATGYVLPGDTEPTPVPAPWVALLPSLDPTTMGWQARDWYLGPHKGPLFDSNGNAGPTIWVDGRIVGGWAIRDGGQVVTALLEDVGGDAELAIEGEAARLSAQLESVRVYPRFPTPLHGKLVG